MAEVGEGVEGPAGLLQPHAVERPQLLDEHVAVVLERRAQAVHRRLDTPLIAAAAACWSTADGPEVSWPWMLVMTSISVVLPTAQPMRKPVMAYCLETPLTMISLELSVRSVAKS